MGRQMSDLLRCGGPSLVLASRHIQSACVPLVVHIFPPLITYSSPCLTALVMIPAVRRGQSVWRDGYAEGDKQGVRPSADCQCGWMDGWVRMESTYPQSL